MTAPSQLGLFQCPGCLQSAAQWMEDGLKVSLLSALCRVSSQLHGGLPSSTGVRRCVLGGTGNDPAAQQHNSQQSQTNQLLRERARDGEREQGGGVRERGGRWQVLVVAALITMCGWCYSGIVT